MSDQERHKGCGGFVYIHHQGNEWYVFCHKCGLKTDIYDNCREAERAWDMLVDMGGDDNALD